MAHKRSMVLSGAGDSDKSHVVQKSLLKHDRDLMQAILSSTLGDQRPIDDIMTIETSPLDRALADFRKFKAGTGSRSTPDTHVNAAAAA
jgi:hypothetical protein